MLGTLSYMGDIKHGTQSAYSYWKCRCEVCVEAKRQRDREYYARTSEDRKAAARRYAAENREKRLRQQAQYRAANREVIQERKRAYYVANADVIKARVAAWRKANPEKDKALRARHRENHREERRQASLDRYYRLMEENPEAVRAYRRQWTKTQKGILANRAARTARRGAAYTKESLEWIASLVDPLCGYCGEPATEIDHIQPISQGGTGELSNLTPACRTCNASKNSLGVEEFLRRLTEKGKK